VSEVIGRKKPIQLPLEPLDRDRLMSSTIRYLLEHHDPECRTNGMALAEIKSLLYPGLIEAQSDQIADSPWCIEFSLDQKFETSEPLHGRLDHLMF
jgi:hypothetical protein